MSYAILVLEQPWWNISKDPSQTSVRHFLDGLSRLKGLPLFYSTFFDTSSFDMALQHLLDARRLDDVEHLIVYVGSHGAGGRIGNGNGPSMNLNTVFDLIQQRGKGKVAGLILDSCEVGGQYETIRNGAKHAKISWVMGYSTSVDWLTSMLINLNMLSVMTSLSPSEIKSRDAMIQGVGKAFAMFNPFLNITVEADKKLLKALTIVIRLPGHDAKILQAEEIWPKLITDDSEV